MNSSQEGSSRGPTLADVARRAGLSKAAASMALRAHPNIPASTRQRVERVAAELGYRPSAVLRNAMSQMRRGRYPELSTELF